MIVGRRVLRPPVYVLHSAHLDSPTSRAVTKFKRPAGFDWLSSDTLNPLNPSLKSAAKP